MSAFDEIKKKRFLATPIGFYSVIISLKWLL